MEAKKILVVEDNVYNMEVVEVFLESAGYLVQKANTAEEGISSAKKELPDLILMDISLPHMDGLTATEVLKKDQKTRNIPILAFTAHAMKEDEDKFFLAGCDGYIIKPIERKSFLDKLNQFLT
jgi:CheY-like chemotaxis protein